MTTTEVSTLSDLELNEAIAKAIGKVPCDLWTPGNMGSAGGPVLWRKCEHEDCYPTHILGSMNGQIGGPPPYATSIDRIGEVEARLRVAGWFQVVSFGADRDVEVRWFAPTDTWGGDPTVDVQLNTPTESRARAEAACQALQALNSPTKEIAND